MTRMNEWVNELVTTIRAVMREHEEKITALENEVRDQKLMAETARETVRQLREQGQKLGGDAHEGVGTGPVMQQCELCARHAEWLRQREQTPMTKKCCVCGRDGWVNSLHQCAHCAKHTKWLRRKEKDDE